ncbi:MAG: hypothetical protein JW704_05540 [Anaerolineaceae bacterium]|nr:hypothetical protein [Anaerolineaceae bacterium]
MTTFIIGFAAGLLLGLVISEFRRLYPRLRESVQASTSARQRIHDVTYEASWREHIRLHVQSLHVASPLFALDEIAIPPRILAAAPYNVPGAQNPAEDLSSNIIPLLYDYPELGSIYNSPSLSIPETMADGADIALVGEPGCGKTFALAYVASSICRQAAETERLNQLMPVYIHASELDLPLPPGQDILAPFFTRITGIYGDKTPSGRIAFINSKFSDGKVLLEIDGLDELSLSGIRDIQKYIAELRTKYPKTRLLLAASPYYLDGFIQMGVVPLPMAKWNNSQTNQLIDRWGKLWNEVIRTKLAAVTNENALKPVQPEFLNAWLKSEPQDYSPLELTLKLWSAYLGCLRGTSQVDIFESFMDNAISHIRIRSALERLAYQMVVKNKISPRNEEIGGLLSGFHHVDLNEQEALLSLPATPGGATEPMGPLAKAPAASSLINTAIQSGLMIDRSETGQVAFIHPVFLGYLASQAARFSMDQVNILDAPQNLTTLTYARFLSKTQDISAQVNDLMASGEADPLATNLFIIARWLRNNPGEEKWKNRVMRNLVEILKSTSTIYIQRARAMAACIYSNQPGLAQLFTKLFSTNQQDLLPLVALGSGLIGDGKTGEKLVEMLNAKSMEQNLGACMALVTLGTKESLEVITHVISSGDERLARLAAEAFAARPELSADFLRNALNSNNVITRYAAVCALGKINENWANPLLSRLSTEDPQWMVRNTALNLYEYRQKGSPFIPKPLPAIESADWAINMASRMNVTVMPAELSKDFLMKAIEQGNAEEKEAILWYFRTIPAPDNRIIETIKTAAEKDERPLQDVAAYTIWLYSMAGIIG